MTVSAQQWKQTNTTAPDCAPTSANSNITGTSHGRNLDNLVNIARLRAAYYAHKWASLQYDDALSDALFGLAVALQQYDPTKGAAFETYARTKMDGYIRHGFRDRSWQKNCKELAARELVSLNVLMELEYEC